MSNKYEAAVQRILAKFGVPLTSSPQTVRGVRKHASAPKNVVVNGVRRVGPDTTPFIEQRGWRRHGKSWTGSFVTKVGTWDGRIEDRGGLLQVFIHRPPSSIIKHQKWCCFHERPGGWFWIHLHRQPHDRDPSAIVWYIERMLSEALAKGEPRRD